MAHWLTPSGATNCMRRAVSSQLQTLVSGLWFDVKGERGDLLLAMKKRFGSMALDVQRWIVS